MKMIFGKTTSNFSQFARILRPITLGHSSEPDKFRKCYAETSYFFFQLKQGIY